MCLTNNPELTLPNDKPTLGNSALNDNPVKEETPPVLEEKKKETTPALENKENETKWSTMLLPFSIGFLLGYLFCLSVTIAAYLLFNFRAMAQASGD